MSNQYFAITGLGWGVGKDADEAQANYLRYQKRNFPHLSDEEIAEAWGFIWEVPADIDGFYNGPEGLVFTRSDGGEALKAALDLRVANVGNVPDEFVVKG